MKKFIDPAHNGGLPLYASDLIWQQEEIYGVMEGIMNGLIGGGSPTGAVIVSGLLYSNQSGVNWDISPGIVYIDGRYYRYDGGTGVNTTGVLVADTTGTTFTRVFKDGNTYNALLENKAVWNSSPPTSDDYISLSVANVDNLRLYAAFNLGSPFTSLSVISSNWTTGTASYYPVPLMRRDNAKYTILAGLLLTNVTTNLNGQVMCTLPDYYRPSRICYFPINVNLDSSGRTLEGGVLKIDTTGEMTPLVGSSSTILHVTTGQAWIAFDGIRFPSKYA